jgi:hypothetical protein
MIGATSLALGGPALCQRRALRLLFQIVTQSVTRVAPSRLIAD